MVGGGDWSKLTSLAETNVDAQVDSNDVLELEQVQVLGDMFSCFNLESMDPEDQSLVKKAVEGAQRLEAAFKLLLRGSAETELVQSLGDWSDLWRREAAKGPLDAAGGKDGVGQFIENCSTIDIRKILIEHMARHASTPDMSAYRSAVRSCSPHLPQPRDHRDPRRVRPRDPGGVDVASCTGRQGHEGHAGAGDAGRPVSEAESTVSARLQTNGC